MGIGLLATQLLAYQRPALAYRRPNLGLLTTKTLAYWRPFIWPINDRSRIFSSYFQLLGQFFSPLTRARDLNLKLTLLTPSHHADSKEGSAPLASQTHPTRLTPTRTALWANQTISNQLPRAARGGGK
jgi:hypothetical protein